MTPGDTDSIGHERTAIVTGGASGIGLAIAERLAADGLAVAIFDLNGDAADAAAAKIGAAGGTALGMTADVTDRAAIDAAVEQVRARLSAPTRRPARSSGTSGSSCR